MTVWLGDRRILLAPAVATAALALGVAAGIQPKLTLGAAAAAGVFILAFRAPVANLTLLLLLTCVVPYDIQNRFSVGGGGVDSPGLFLSDIVLSAGLLAAVVVLLHEPLDRRRVTYASVLVLFLALAFLQFLHGMGQGRDLSRIGYEYRILLGTGSFLIAVPLLAHPRSRRRLLIALTGVGVALGAWGMLQWFGHLSYGGDVGVRPGVLQTTTGTGQLQGGEFAYPAAIVLCFAVLVSGALRSIALRVALVVALALNAASCFFTFERTFWLGALLGVGIVFILMPRGPRLKLALALPIVALAGIATLAVLAPKQFTTAEQRALSLGRANQDESVRYRLVESRFVVARIRADPVTGSGLGATIFWGRPWQQVVPATYAFSHNGFLWLAWKVGIPTALLLVGLLLSAIFLRAPPGDDTLTRAIRNGSRGALAGLLLATTTFSTFNELNITSAIGVLLALAVCPVPDEPR